VALPTHPHLAPKLKKEYSYTSIPDLGLYGQVQGELKMTNDAAFTGRKRAIFTPSVGTSGISVRFAALARVNVRQTRHKCMNNIRSRRDMFELLDFVSKLKAVIRCLFFSWSICQTVEEWGVGAWGGGKGEEGKEFFAYCFLNNRVGLNSHFEKVLMEMYSWPSL
jgi:hypothetical protein